MAQTLRQSTAVTVAIGPFLDAADGVTALTGLSITQPDIRLSKNGAAFAQKSAAQTLSHMENGYYSLSLSTTDTDAVGRLTLHVNKAGALPVFYEFQVAEEAVYDAIFAEDATGALPVSAGGISSTALAADASTAIGDAVLAALKSQDRRGVAQGAGSGSDTLVLAVGDQEADDFYNGAIIVVLEGAGSNVTVAERTRRIIDYENSTNQVQVDAPWADPVDDSTVYLVVGG